VVGKRAILLYLPADMLGEEPQKVDAVLHFVRPNIAA